MGMAQLLRFCLDVSQRNGGAVPVLVAHNARFDNNMLLSACWQAGMDVPDTWRTLCTHQAVQQMKRDVAPPLLLDLPNTKLGSLAVAFGCALHNCVWPVAASWAV